MAVILCVHTVSFADPASRSIGPRIRIFDAGIRAHLPAALRRSPELRSLVARLESSDVIVYVVGGNCRPRAAACLMLTAANTDARYVRVQIPPEPSPQQRLALLGHELRHAVEVAAHPEVVTSEGMAQLYQSIGFAACWPERRCYDTLAARESGYTVLDDLRSAAVADRAAAKHGSPSSPVRP